MTEGPVITVAAGETLWLDGRMLKFQTPARVMLPRGCRFLRGRDIVTPAVDLPPPELDAYLAVQAAHLGPRANYRELVAIAQDKLARLAAIEAALAFRALDLHRSHHALLALRPLVCQHLGHEETTALCA